MTTHIQTPTITYATAARAVELSLEVAAEHGVKAVVTVVDPSLVPVAFGRADGAPPHSVETSRRKASTAASMRKASSAIARELTVALEHGSGGLLTGIAGGVPLGFGGVHTAGLGIAGGTPQQDAEIASVVLERLGADSIGAN